MEMFIEKLSIYGDTFDICLENLVKVLRRCEEVKLVLNWEKCHFMVQEGVVLGHVISNWGINVDRVKVEVIEWFHIPPLLKGHGVSLVICDFLATLSRISLKSLSLLPSLDQRHPLYVYYQFSSSLWKDQGGLDICPYNPTIGLGSIIWVNKQCTQFCCWNDFRAKSNKKPFVTYYTSKELDEAQMNYSIMEKEVLDVVFVIKNFC